MAKTKAKRLLSLLLSLAMLVSLAVTPVYAADVEDSSEPIASETGEATTETDPADETNGDSSAEADPVEEAGEDSVEETEAKEEETEETPAANNGISVASEEVDGDETTTYVASVGGTGYATLAEAIAAAEASETVKLLTDVDLSAAISSGKTMTLDLNGCTITNEGGGYLGWAGDTLEGEALTIIDSVGSGSMVNSGDYILRIVERGQVILNGGYIVNTTSDRYGAIYMRGTSVASSTKVTVNSGAVVTNTASSGYAIYCAGNCTVEVSGGRVSTGLDKNGKNVTGSSNGCAIYAYGASGSTVKEVKITVTSGEVTTGTASGQYAMYLRYDPTVEITGGTVSTASTSGYAIYKTSASGTITISGGAISATGASSCAIYSLGGTITISGGTISATGKSPSGQSKTIYMEYGTLTITGGTISANIPSGTGYAVYFGRQSTSNAEIGVLTISGGTISTAGAASNLYAVYVTGYSNRITATIEGGTISTDSASTGNSYPVYAYGTILNITGGVMQSANADVSTVTADGTSSSSSYYKAIVTISGGRVENAAGNNVVNCKTYASLSIIDGYFYGTDLDAVATQVEEYIPEGYITSQVSVEDANYETYVTVGEEPKYFTVVYGNTNRYTVVYEEDASYDLTQPYSEELGYGVSENCLYAGVYTDRYWYEPIDGTTELGDGLAFYPEADKTYYVKEISDDYLEVKCLYAWTDADGIVNLWPVTGIDDENYSEIGFIIDDDSTYTTGAIGETGTKLTDSSVAYAGTEIYSRLDIEYPGAEEGYESVHATCMNLFNVGGYLAVTQALDELLADYKDDIEQPVTMQAYYVTQDGVMVTGAWQRTITFTEDFSNFTYVDTKIGSTTSYPDDDATPVVLSLAVSDACVLTASVPEETTTYTITKYDGDNVSTQEVAEGDDVEITCTEKDGYLFGGWFMDESCTEAADFSNITGDMTVYAKYVSADYMQVKIVVQSTKGVAKTLRFIAAVDSKNYAKVGFKYEYNGTEETVEVTKYSTTASGYTAAKLFGGDVVTGSKLIYNDFSVSKISAGTEITVTPYWVTQDGTMVYGTARTVTFTGTTVQ
ncbi:MAG: InlB B-repeat-containing protein [Clostridiales bacterium]|nr:InlB B-repeat-containing protein [Clostridiales bacterium]